jgi:hypothetical protein
MRPHHAGTPAAGQPVMKDGVFPWKMDMMHRMEPDGQRESLNYRITEKP